MPLTWMQQRTTATAWNDSGSRVAVVQRQGGNWRAVLVGLGLFGTDLGTTTASRWRCKWPRTGGTTGVKRTAIDL